VFSVIQQGGPFGILTRNSSPLNATLLFANEFDSRFRDPRRFAFRALGRLPQFVVAEFEAALFAGSHFNYWFVFGVLERLEQMLEVFDGVFAGLIGETSNLRDGHRTVEEHWN
jgi:hypothetical protein